MVVLVGSVRWRERSVLEGVMIWMWKVEWSDWGVVGGGFWARRRRMHCIVSLVVLLDSRVRWSCGASEMSLEDGA